jgi:biofilm PGA synthesis N-glycosyltransferase PgaC
VAGNVRVGNVGNMVTRWQALDYIIGIHIERNAQAFLGAVMIVPGACGAFRKEAVLKAGGYSHRTLAEDFDLTLSIQRLGYKVLQDNSAQSYTEAPETVKALAKQRFRWMYGNVQAYWKHRDMIFRRRHGWAGLFVLPWAIFSFVLPLVFVPMLMFIAIENIVAGNAKSMLVFLAATIAIQAVMAVIGVAMARERWSLLLAVPMTRLMYSPMRTYLMYRTLFNVMRGVSVGWNKLQRTGSVGQTSSYARRPRHSQAQLRPATAMAESEDG